MQRIYPLIGEGAIGVRKLNCYGRTLRTLVQFVRSGQLGRKSLSYALQRAVQRWLNTASVEKLLSASIGNDPSLRDEQPGPMTEEQSRTAAG